MKTTQREPRSRVAEYINGIDCADCGVLFGLSQDYEEARQRDGQTFYCPNGHPNFYPDNEEARAAELAQQLRAEQARNAQLKNDLLDQAAKTNRLRKRIEAGVCPHCKRTFQNVARHMKTKKHGA